MIEKLKKWISNIFTEPDNKTICPVRIVALVSVFHFHALVTANYFQHHVFDPQSYAVGCGTLIAGAGVALGLKKDTPQ